VRAIFERNVTGWWLSSTVTTPLLFLSIPVPPVIVVSIYLSHLLIALSLLVLPSSSFIVVLTKYLSVRSLLRPSL